MRRVGRLGGGWASGWREDFTKMVTDAWNGGLHSQYILKHMILNFYYIENYVDSYIDRWIGLIFVITEISQISLFPRGWDLIRKETNDCDFIQGSNLGYFFLGHPNLTSVFVQMFYG